MSVTTTTHLNFRGQARAALEHYADVFGGEVQAFTFAQGGSDRDRADGAVDDQVIWGAVQSPSGFSVMAFDVPPGRAYDPGTDALYVSVRGDDADEITRCFDGLAQGGTVRAALGPAGFSPHYGMVTDRFGVTWVLDVAVAY
ncbi:VOC family protein [Modestobacter sp. Leaf380]|uniref:VOC family protein n=1 Tax=Modestobacter sp. Leaf380 TaxID=1736356 RepID=UPI0006F9C3DA|nr:VOC family protein [Modestobacter sp. Leaf380]KQS66521.1 bleomycin resistance protein [Modestobacter sp. Leaf380]